jgi:hypothetical protein
MGSASEYHQFLPGRRLGPHASGPQPRRQANLAYLRPDGLHEGWFEGNPTASSCSPSQTPNKIFGCALRIWLAYELAPCAWHLDGSRPASVSSEPTQVAGQYVDRHSLTDFFNRKSRALG